MPSTSLDKLTNNCFRCNLEGVLDPTQQRAASTLLSHLRATTKARSVGSCFLAQCKPETVNLMLFEDGQTSDRAAAASSSAPNFRWVSFMRLPLG